MIRPSCEETVLLRHRDLKHNYYSLTFGPYSRAKECRPGSFIHVHLPHTDVYFRRAMSVAAIDPKKKEIEIIFKIFGRGTTLLSKFAKDAKLDILGPLGAPFALPTKTERVVIVAGGVGFPPLMFLATDLVQRGYDPKKIEFFYGGRSDGDIVERARIKKLGVNFHVTTDDGSLGEKGFVTRSVESFIKAHGSEKLRLYGCGPDAMLKATNDLGLKYELPGQLSLEAPMPCGIGVCLGCVVKTTRGDYVRVCVEGPVFNIGEVEL
ncbi:MAG: dihydroorotate dehydrogenase electron transfer subunit [candidate division Zixibacteria bacterium]|nr:dihydroorotate dehydrogenase electron transfer subunit [candidate division Zixibacteria bacterium]